MSQNNEVTPELLQKALKQGTAKEITLPGLPDPLVMVDYVVFDKFTAKWIMQRSVDGRWWGNLPAIWVQMLEETYRANFG